MVGKQNPNPKRWQKPELKRLGALIDVAGPLCVDNDGALVGHKNIGPGCS